MSRTLRKCSRVFLCVAHLDETLVESGRAWQKVHVCGQVWTASERDFQKVTTHACVLTG
jgi:hypothetical protein